MNIKTKALLLTLAVFLPPCYLLFNHLDFVELVPYFGIFVYLWPFYTLLALYFFFSRILDRYNPEGISGTKVVINFSAKNYLEQYNRSSFGVLYCFTFLFVVGFGAKIHFYGTGKTDFLELLGFYALNLPGTLLMLFFVLRSFFYIVRYFLYDKKIYFFSFIFIVFFIIYYLFIF